MRDRGGGKDPAVRAARLKAALQANIARRKAQARARTESAAGQEQEEARND